MTSIMYINHITVEIYLYIYGELVIIQLYISNYYGQVYNVPNIYFCVILYNDVLYYVNFINYIILFYTLYNAKNTITNTIIILLY